MPFEGHKLPFRAKVINAPNHANFGLPNGNAQTGSFGSITGLTNGASGQIFQPGLRYGFYLGSERGEGYQTSRLLHIH